MNLVEELRNRVEEVSGGNGTVLEFKDDLCSRAADEIELLRGLIQVEREIQHKVCTERDHWFRLVPNDVARANPYNPKQ